ncbi:hypothetical protein EBO15_35880 [Actinomadura harenae]|uniref:Uncharacterized protein n=1 Tax=Actinomadura harenae TaxID=2483351 RepID=A0A3M2LMZ8_9ACTN|nr:hypothetical protein EBO15_35880 [Actinomadura harenae]
MPSKETAPSDWTPITPASDHVQAQESPPLPDPRPVGQTPPPAPAPSDTDDPWTTVRASATPTRVDPLPTITPEPSTVPEDEAPPQPPPAPDAEDPWRAAPKPHSADTEDDELWTTVRQPEATVTHRDPGADGPAVADDPAPPSETSPPSFGAESPSAPEDTWTATPAGGRHRSPEPALDRLSGQPGAHRSPREDGLVDQPFTPEPEPLTDTPSPSPPPPPSPSPSRTRPDITARDRVPTAPRREQRPYAAENMSHLDARARRTLVDEFVGDFVGGPTWQALLVVLEGAFPGMGVAATLAMSADEIWREIAVLEEHGAVARIGVPLWLGPAGLEVDLSAHWHFTPANGSHPRPRASRPYPQALVVDTVDPLRYHRPVSGPSSPHDRVPHFAPALDQPDENGRGRVSAEDEDDTGVVIVADLTAAGVRVLDATAVWRHASRIVADTLRDPRRPETWTRARRTLRSLRRVVMLDPRLGLGLCLGLDDRRTPRCLLVFRIERTEVATPRFVRP